ncbi:NAD kinase [Desulfovibrionales bacterium]
MQGDTMLTSVQVVSVIVRTGDRRAYTLGQEMGAWLSERGLSVYVFENATHRADVLCELAPASDLALVLGGDGTMLSVARWAIGSCTPLLGINLGKVGFFTEISAADWREPLANLLEHGAQLLELPALTYVVERRGRSLSEGKIINDLVVNRGILARLLSLELRLEEEVVGSIRCDGLIAATPAGSTAYGFSAGGPLLHPSLDAWCLVPVCPFLCDLRPMVLSSAVGVEIIVLEGTAEAHLSLDGQEGIPLKPGDRLRIRRSLRGIFMVTLGDGSWVSKLKHKGFFGRFAFSK